MSSIAAKIAIALFTRFLTERFVSKLVVYSCDYLAKKTTNNLDDKMAGAVAEALGIEVK